MNKNVQPSDKYLSHVGVMGMKWGVRRGAQRLGNWTKEAGKMTKNNFKHPFLTTKANRESLKADTTGNKVRRTMVYQNTKDLKDINSRVNKMVTKLNNKKISTIQKDIDSFKPFVKTGILTKHGKVMLSSLDVEQSISALKKSQEKYK